MIYLTEIIKDGEAFIYEKLLVDPSSIYLARAVEVTPERAIIGKTKPMRVTTVSLKTGKEIIVQEDLKKIDKLVSAEK